MELKDLFLNCGDTAVKKNCPKKLFFQVAHLLLCHSCLVFKIVFATYTMLWAHLLRNEVSSLMSGMFKENLRKRSYLDAFQFLVASSAF